MVGVSLEDPRARLLDVYTGSQTSVGLAGRCRVLILVLVFARACGAL